jgi:hypothetical protein
VDAFSHGLWGAAVAEVVRRKRGGTRGQVALAAVLGIAPDVGQLLPVAAWFLAQSEPGAILEFIRAVPGGEPSMPDAVRATSHHLHCVFHSAPIAITVSLAPWRLLGRLWIPLVGWWSHIAVDVPTHSGDYYAVPVFYPFTYWGFDGVAWTNPWVMGLGYAALGVVYARLWRTR